MRLRLEQQTQLWVRCLRCKHGFRRTAHLQYYQGGDILDFNGVEDGTTPQPFETWSNGYGGGINRAISAAKEVDDYFASLGWPCILLPRRELTLTVRLPDGTSKARRLDIADQSTRRAIEFKQYNEGKVYKSADVETEVLLDKEILKNGTMTDIEWVFKGCTPSIPLRQLLEAGPNPIRIKIIP